MKRDFKSIFRYAVQIVGWTAATAFIVFVIALAGVYSVVDYFLYFQ
jgi:hypothetical protein